MADQPVHPVIERLGAYSWRIIVIAAVLAGAFWVLGEVRLIILPLVIALFLTRALSVPSAWLRNKGWRPGFAAAAALVGFLAVVALAGTLIGGAVFTQSDELGPTIGEAVDDVERWLVEDSPFDIEQGDIDRVRREAGDAISRALRSSSGELIAGAVAVIEALVGIVLGLLMTFFLLKDGDRFVRWAQGLIPERRRELVGHLGARAWRTLGGYLRGAAALGFVESIVIGLALLVVGADLVVPMMVLTFMAAFVPFVGAIVAGALAVLVTLATAGAPEAAIILVVAIIVQQLDNDLLAPLIYGRALELHPVAVLLGVTAGGSAFGLGGSFLAVPVIAVVINVLSELRARLDEEAVEPDTVAT